jgi:hypothetical protein
MLEACRTELTLALANNLSGSLVIILMDKNLDRCGGLSSWVAHT